MQAIDDNMACSRHYRGEASMMFQEVESLDNDDEIDMVALASSSSGSSISNDGSSCGKLSSMTKTVPTCTENNVHGSLIKCPRCESTNTKFCYYNNYKESQPRYFCKSCRRYWTQGGALRNVPVGGGCRKNKKMKPRTTYMTTTGVVIDPSYFINGINMSARMSSSTISSFDYGPTSFGDGNSNILLVNEGTTYTPLPSSASPFYLDVGFTDLVNTCTNDCGIHHKCAGTSTCTCPLLMRNYDRGLDNGTCYKILPRNASRGLISSSATATLASIEDQLSNFSNSVSLGSFSSDGCMPTGVTQLEVVEEQECVPSHQYSQEMQENMLFEVVKQENTYSEQINQGQDEAFSDILSKDVPSDGDQLCHVQQDGHIRDFARRFQEPFR